MSNKKTIELYVNELIYTLTSDNAEELKTWLSTLCAVTGLELDVHQTTVSSTLKYSKKSIDESNIWKTTDVPQLNEYNPTNDKNLVKKVSGNT